jgi:hypothetical protein
MGRLHSFSESLDVRWASSELHPSVYLTCKSPHSSKEACVGCWPTLHFLPSLDCPTLWPVCGEGWDIEQQRESSNGSPICSLNAPSIPILFRPIAPLGTSVVPTLSFIMRAMRVGARQGKLTGKDGPAPQIRVTVIEVQSFLLVFRPTSPQ